MATAIEMSSSVASRSRSRSHLHMHPAHESGTGLEDLIKNQPKPRKSSLSGRLLLLLFSVACIAVIYCLRTFPPHLKIVPSHTFGPFAPAPKPLGYCPHPAPPLASPPVPVNVWASLTAQDVKTIAAWLNAPDRALNLTASHIAHISDNYIYHIGAWRPAKSDALAFLQNPESAPLPPRYARVTIHHGAADVPKVQDYLVGPLPVDDVTQIRTLTEVYHRSEIPYNARGYTTHTELNPILIKVMTEMADATQARSELFGGVALGFPNDTLIGAASGPLSFDGTFRRGWINWKRNVPGPYLHPVGFFIYIDISGTDTAEWKLLKVVYNHQMFGSVEDFMSAFYNGTLQRAPKGPIDSDLDWTTRRRPHEGFIRDLDHLPGPRSVSFAGLRFRVDRKTQYVSWMGWGMYLGFDRDMGLSLWDIRFRRERLIYELSPQEAIAQYAGNDPTQTSTAWLDRFFGMGTSVRDMLPGYDCPHDAVYLPATTSILTRTITSEKAICIFEHDSERPLTRHAGYSEGEFGAVRAYNLVVRSISTIGNYDYVFDYIFHLDGTIEVRLSASGYLQGGFWEPYQENYGTAIRHTTMGSLHDHVINYKVDLDVAGERNSLLYTHMDQEEIQQPWVDDDWGSTVLQQRITRTFLENEDDALLKYPYNFQGGYSIVNRAARNRWGVLRGYAIHPGYNPVYNTVVGSKRLLENANWARYNLAVSKRKDTEPSSSSMWNQNLPGSPAVNFHMFFDGENITQEDLVAWVNVGMHHLPQAEDSPNTRTNVATSSFFITPQNFFDFDVSTESSNAILMSPPTARGDPWAYYDNGVKDANCVPVRLPPFEYKGIKAVDLDGEHTEQDVLYEMQKTAEMYHRIELEL